MAAAFRHLLLLFSMAPAFRHLLLLFSMAPAFRYLLLLFSMAAALRHLLLLFSMAPALRHLLLLPQPCCGKILPHCPQNQTIIRIHNPAVFYRNHIIKAAPPVHAQRKGAVFYLISKRKFHFVAVFVLRRTSLDAFPTPVFLLSAQTGIQQTFHLLFLHLQLIAVWQ